MQIDQHSNFSALRQALHPWQREGKGCGVIKDALVGTYVFSILLQSLSPIVYVNILGALDTNLNICKGWNKSMRLGIVEYLQSF